MKSLLKFITGASKKEDNGSRKKKDALDSEAKSKSKGTSKSNKDRKSRKEAKIKRSAKGSVVSEQTEATTLSDAAVNEHLIQDYISKVNEHASVEELLQFYAREDAPIKFDDMAPMPAVAVQTEIVNLTKSFKDFKFSYDSVKEIKPGVVQVDELVVSGTHNGEPYKFAVFPPVPATGKHVVLDPERSWFYMNDGKIVKEVITALGNLTGPPGMYISIGGNMDMAPPPPQEEESP
ncbi:expressed unknown protein [Seminavis robusta]|uniref:SnoaL-like domain-containing protein n=1 Tax=Seminavis robusta TaxID=568900 RepID=A0A9N8DN09_9STRA|nr:expressed unknown protein [Seminavis robusta]|eukprot:Sro145_g067320.1 n/a (235) ;mRNA; f:60478-61182